MFSIKKIISLSLILVGAIFVPLYMLDSTLLIRNLIFYNFSELQKINYLNYTIRLLACIPIGYVLYKANFKHTRYILAVLISITVIVITYNLPQTNPDIASYLYYGKYVEKFGVIDYIKKFSSPLIDSWVNAPGIGIYLAAIGYISQHNFIYFHILNVITFLLLAIVTSKITSNKFNTSIFVLFISIPYLLSQSYLFLTDIPSSLLFLAGFYILERKSGNKYYGYLLLLLSFLTKYLLIMYIVPYVIFKIFTRNKTENIIPEVLLVTLISTWILLKPSAFYVLFIKTIIEKTSLNNSLLAGITDIKTIIPFAILSALPLLYFLINPIQINLNFNKKRSNVILYPLITVLILFLKTGFDTKFYFYRSALFGSGPIFFLYILHLYNVFFNYKYKLDSLDLYIVIFSAISLFTPNMMFKYIIPLYPFIVISCYRYLEYSANKSLIFLIYLLALINLSIFTTFYTPMIRNWYDKNFIEANQYLKEIKNNNISVVFLENTSLGKMRRSYDYTLLTIVNLHSPKNIKLSLINMDYETDNDYRAAALIKYTDSYYPEKNPFKEIYPSKNISEAINSSNSFMVICDYECNQENNITINEIIENNYSKLIELPLVPYGTWMNKTIIYEKSI